MAEAHVSRRQVLKVAAATGIATTSPWWLVNKSHAQRAKKIVYWHIPNFTPKADDLQKEQVYEFAKQAGVKENEVEYAVVANEQFQAKLAASIEAGNPPDVTRLYESNVQFYASGGHLLDLTDVVDKMRKEPKGIFESALVSVLYKGRAMGAPLAVNPWPVHARIDLLEKAKVDYPKTWDEFIETSKKIQDPPRLFAFGICLGLVEDTSDNVMNILWCYGGKMVEADNKTVVMNSPENAAGVKVIEAMFKTHKIIAPGSISWDNSGNNKAYQSKQAAFVMNPTSVYAYLDGNDKDLQKATGLFPVPAGPKGTVNQIDTWAFGAFKKNPYPDLAKGLVDYFMQPQNYDKIIQSTGVRWVPVYKRLFDSPFWKE
jgi:multiple sugar transport system substrate-binding protein